MERLDDWASAIGESVCSYLMMNGHDAFYRGLCYAGPSPAGWRFVLFLLIFGGISVFVWRMFKPA